MRGLALAVLLLHTPFGGALGPTPFERAPSDVVCPSCRIPTYIAIVDTYHYDYPPTVFYDECTGAKHVHSYAWDRTTYACARCLGRFEIVTEEEPCPVCGWERLDQRSYPSPCEQTHYSALDPGGVSP